MSDARVIEAVVVRRPDAKWGEVPVASVACHAPAPSVEELFAVCRARLARYSSRRRSATSPHPTAFLAALRARCSDRRSNDSCGETGGIRRRDGEPRDCAPASCGTNFFTSRQISRSIQSQPSRNWRLTKVSPRSYLANENRRLNSRSCVPISREARCPARGFA